MSLYVSGVALSIHEGMVCVDTLADMLQVRYCHSNTMMHACGFPVKKNMISSEHCMVMW